MNAQTLRDALSAAPFQPFCVVTSGGLTYDIRHPEMAWVTRTNLLVGVGMDPASNTPGEFKTLSLFHITALEPPTVPSINPR